jgi:hypothetical protein
MHAYIHIDFVCAFLCIGSKSLLLQLTASSSIHPSIHPSIHHRPNMAWTEAVHDAPDAFCQISAGGPVSTSLFTHFFFLEGLRNVSGSWNFRRSPIVRNLALLFILFLLRFLLASCCCCLSTSINSDESLPVCPFLPGSIHKHCPMKAPLTPHHLVHVPLLRCFTSYAFSEDFCSIHPAIWPSS